MKTNTPVRPHWKQVVFHAGVYAMLIGIAVSFLAYAAGLRAGAIRCNHRCYWCGEHLEAKAP